MFRSKVCVRVCTAGGVRGCTVVDVRVPVGNVHVCTVVVVRACTLVGGRVCLVGGVHVGEDTGVDVSAVSDVIVYTDTEVSVGRLVGGCVCTIDDSCVNVFDVHVCAVGLVGGCVCTNDDSCVDVFEVYVCAVGVRVWAIEDVRVCKSSDVDVCTRGVVGVSSDGRVYILNVVHVFACGVCVRTIGDVCVWTFSVGQDYIGAGRVYTVTGALVSPIIGGLMCRDDVVRVRIIVFVFL